MPDEQVAAVGINIFIIVAVAVALQRETKLHALERGGDRAVRSAPRPARDRIGQPCGDRRERCTRIRIRRKLGQCAQSDALFGNRVTVAARDLDRVQRIHDDARLRCKARERGLCARNDKHLETAAVAAVDDLAPPLVHSAVRIQLVHLLRHVPARVRAGVRVRVKAIADVALVHGGHGHVVPAVGNRIRVFKQILSVAYNLVLIPVGQREHRIGVRRTRDLRRNRHRHNHRIARCDFGQLQFCSGGDRLGGVQRILRLGKVIGKAADVNRLGHITRRVGRADENRLRDALAVCRRKRRLADKGSRRAGDVAVLPARAAVGRILPCGNTALVGEGDLDRQRARRAGEGARDRARLCRRGDAVHRKVKRAGCGQQGFAHIARIVRGADGERHAREVRIVSARHGTDKQVVVHRLGGGGWAFRLREIHRRAGSDARPPRRRGSGLGAEHIFIRICRTVAAVVQHKSAGDPGRARGVVRDGKAVAEAVAHLRIGDALDRGRGDVELIGIGIGICRDAVRVQVAREVAEHMTVLGFDRSHADRAVRIGGTEICMDRDCRKHKVCAVLGPV